MILFILLVLSVALSSCCNSETDASKFDWVQSEVNEDYVDVFYMTSTCVFHSYLPDSTESYTVTLNDDEVNYLSQEDLYVRNHIFGDSLNFFAPLYHQFTMSAVTDCSRAHFDSIYRNVADEMCAAFDDYMEHKNGGRRFVLAGFSQGAMYVREILNHMTEEQYSRMVAAYMLGYGLSAHDCESNRIVPAIDRFSNGVTVSFNTVSDTSQIWPIVYNNACTCVNPITWETDAAACDFCFEGDTLTVAADTLKNVLIVTGFDPEKYPLSFEAPWPKGCLHHFEIFFYNESLYRNVLDRAYQANGSEGVLGNSTQS